MSGTPDRLVCLPVDGLGEVAEGDDLPALLATAADLADGDVLVVTSKVVSKAEGRVVAADRRDALAGETDRVLATRGPTAIVRTHHGLVMAAAGIDASNTAPGTAVLLPRDPDGSARGLRERLLATTGRNVAVLVTDTAGRAWRAGQTDIAIGAAGLEVLDDHAGRTDPYGNELAVTAPALADEVAAAADLVKGKLGRRPAAVVRGLARLVLPAGEHGPGAAALVRPESQDMFGLGAREAVLAALAGDPGDLRGFGAPCDAGLVDVHLRRLAGGAQVSTGDGLVTLDLRGLDEPDAAATRTRVAAAAFALGWLPAPGAATPGVLRFTPATP
jgi:coenzyme F420-0:L-glutamate ligase/coenzyme F420-1:gamma-L-glutamate ligase